MIINESTRIPTRAGDEQLNGLPQLTEQRARLLFIHLHIANEHVQLAHRKIRWTTLNRTR